MKRRGFLRRLAMTPIIAALATEISFLNLLEEERYPTSLHELILRDSEILSPIVTHLFYGEGEDKVFPLSLFVDKIKENETSR